MRVFQRGAHLFVGWVGLSCVGPGRVARRAGLLVAMKRAAAARRPQELNRRLDPEASGLQRPLGPLQKRL
jgi:hypothetical protein